MTRTEVTYKKAADHLFSQSALGHCDPLQTQTNSWKNRFLLKYKADGSLNFYGAWNFHDHRDRPENGVNQRGPANGSCVSWEITLQVRQLHLLSNFTDESSP